MMRDIDEAAKADALLTEHYYWQKTWRPALGVPRCAPECRQAITSRQWDTTEDLHDSYLHSKEMESVEWCLDEIDGESRQVIGCEMRNREANAAVWRPTSKRTYTEAVAAIIPLMQKRNLL